MAKGKMTKGKTLIYKTLHRKLNVRSMSKDWKVNKCHKVIGGHKSKEPIKPQSAMRLPMP